MACSDSSSGPKDGAKDAVLISPREVTVEVGGTATLTATVKDAQGNDVRGAAIFWSSADTALAVVSPEGLVRGKKAGTVKVAASANGHSDVATVTIAPQSVAAVSLSPLSQQLTVGASTQLTATPLGAGGQPLQGRTITWTTDRPSIASVDANGRVTGLAAGAASITATVEGKSAAAAITVVLIGVGGVAVTPTSAALVVGQTTQLNAAVTDVNGAPLRDRNVTWTSSNQAAATVSSTGLVIALAPGSATITATVEGKSASAVVTVAPIPVSTVIVSPSPAQIIVGQTVTLSVLITDASGRIVDPPKTFSSDNSAIATVNQSGVVTGVAPGTTTVRVTSEGKVGTTTVVVSPIPVASVTVSPSSASLTVGGTTQLTAVTKDASGNTLTGRAITWTSSNTAVATVSGTGVVTAVAPGLVTIFAASEGRTGSAAVSVSPIPVGSVTVTPPSANIQVGQTTQLSVTVKDVNGTTVTDRAVTWISSDSRIALVSSTGLVTGVAPGTVTITATSEGKSSTSSVTVAAVPVASVTVSPSAPSVQVGLTTQLSATVKDASGNTLTGRTVTWISNNTNVATVSSTGVVTGVAQGTATITATSEGKSGTATVTVTPPPGVVASVSLTPLNPTMKMDANLTLTAACLDATGAALSGKTITWTKDVSDAVATLSTTTGTSTVLRPKRGDTTVKVTATCDGKSATSTVTVTN